MPTPKISIIVPVYNAEAYLDACLQSTLSQSLADFEVVMVNDGSKDQSAAMLDAYAARDARVRVLHKENGGASSARNAGIDLACGEYLFFLDSDDRLPPGALRALYEAAERTSADVVFGGYRLFGWHSGEHLGMQATMDQNTFRRQYFSLVDAYLGYPSWAKLFRRSVITENAIRYNTAQKLSEDHTFNVTVYRHADRFTMIPEVVYDYNTGNVASINKRYDPNYGMYRTMEYDEVYRWIGADREAAFEQAGVAFRCCLNTYLRHCSPAEAAPRLSEAYRRLAEISAITPAELDRALGTELLPTEGEINWVTVAKAWYRTLRGDRIRRRLSQWKIKLLHK